LASLPNSITFLRFFLSCVFCALLHGLFTAGRGFIPAMTVFLAICATDLLDGWLARRLGAATVFGAFLDIFADVFYVASSLTVLAALQKVPAWFIAVVLLKFIEYIKTSHILRRSENLMNTPFVRDPPGRCAAVLYFLLPGAICVFGSIPGVDFRLAVDSAICTAALLTLLSFAIRCRYCIKALRVQKQAA
jgi:CDP-diacylglycerol--glycerol-3-phosphate 3-phosphatidyltransferase